MLLQFIPVYIANINNNLDAFNSELYLTLKALNDITSIVTHLNLSRYRNKKIKVRKILAIVQFTSKHMLI